MKQRKIIQFGHPTLRVVTTEVPDGYIGSTEIKTVIASLKNSIPENGIGLAASQINESWRIFLGDISKESWSEDPAVPIICINPVVEKFGDQIGSDWEGCLSAPGLWGMVDRPYQVTVSYTTESGDRIEGQVLRGVAARVFQHELDHLDGVLFVDRMTDMKTLMTDEEFNKIRDQVRK